ncbi:MAG TPA: DJ-1/PfpI family protein [Allosphingosinicella sp.]|nr:DJ-1/PfpI family protein [Allosphingosinicella sp.]
MPEPISIAFLLYPRVTQLDLTGPAQFLARLGNQKIDLVWKNKDPVPTDCGFSIVPTATFGDIQAADIICIPGGPGSIDVMEDEQVLAWINAVAADAKWVTSVCTGSLILAAAGLLKGYRATSHWAWREYLPLFGAEPVEERIVFDRNRVTGGGVTTGIDFGLALTAAVRGDDFAKAVQLGLEYDPAPPFDSGSPEKAGADLTAFVRARSRRESPDREPRIKAVAERMREIATERESSPQVPRIRSLAVDRAAGQLIATMALPVPAGSLVITLLDSTAARGRSYRLATLPVGDPGTKLAASIDGMGEGTYLVRVEVDGISTIPDLTNGRFTGPLVSI